MRVDGAAEQRFPLALDDLVTEFGQQLLEF